MRKKCVLYICVCLPKLKRFKETDQCILSSNYLVFPCLVGFFTHLLKSIQQEMKDFIFYQFFFLIGSHSRPYISKLLASISRRDKDQQLVTISEIRSRNPKTHLSRHFVSNYFTTISLKLRWCSCLIC